MKQRSHSAGAHPSTSISARGKGKNMGGKTFAKLWETFPSASRTFAKAGPKVSPANGKLCWNFSLLFLSLNFFFLFQNFLKKQFFFPSGTALFLLFWDAVCFSSFLCDDYFSFITIFMIIIIFIMKFFCTKIFISIKFKLRAASCISSLMQPFLCF